MQDKAITQIGKIQLAQLGDKKPYELYIQNMFPEKDNYDIILAVFNFNETENGFDCAFEGVDIQKVSKNNYAQFAYRKGSARGGDITFTTKFGDIEKKFKTLVENQLKPLVQKLQTSENQNEFSIFSTLLKFLQNVENFQLVKKQLSDVYEALSKEQKTSSGLSILFKVKDETKYLIDFKVIQDILTASGTEEKSEKYDVKSEGKNQICSICLQKKEILHGFASPFKYATVDKPGMVSGFFKQANNWKNYPICTDCSLHFELGRTYITSNLSRYFYGKAFYAIPKTLIGDDTDSLKKSLRYLKDLYGNLIEDSNKTVKNEDRIWELVAIEDDYFNLNLLFYEENPTTKAIKIKLMLEEIVPSRFRKLFVDIPKQINEHPLYEKAIVIKKETFPLEFRFGILKNFFDDDFYELIQKTFMLQKFSKENLYARFMTVIRENYNKMQTSDGYVENTKLTVLKAHLTLRYFQALGLIEYNSNFKFMDTLETQERKSSFDLDKLRRFITENQDFLDTDYKIGIFSVGILVRLLLNIQQRELSNTPFENKLRGYHLNHELLKNIYLEALVKISQYQKNFFAYGNLKDFIAQHFVLNAHKLSKISNNELSFYFVAGLEFGNQFKTKED